MQRKWWSYCYFGVIASSFFGIHTLRQFLSCVQYLFTSISIFWTYSFTIIDIKNIICKKNLHHQLRVNDFTFDFLLFERILQHILNTYLSKLENLLHENIYKFLAISNMLFWIKSMFILHLFFRLDWGCL